MKTLNLTYILRIILFYLLMTIPFWGMILSAQADHIGISSKEVYESILQEEFGDYQTGATAIVAKGGNILYRGAVGKANIELDVNAKPEHVFRIGSITKQFTAVAILQLEEQGKLSISDPITKYIPTYPTQGQTITIEHLLTHASGIKSYTGRSEFEDTYGKDLKPMEIVDVFKDQPMEFKPGEKFYYNNYGYILLGVIIEKLSGMPYSDYIQKYIFDPIGMQSSYYDKNTQVIPMRVAGYEWRKDHYTNAEYLNMTLPYAAGALLSNVDDLYKWNQAIHAHKVVSENSLKKAFTPYKLKDGSVTSYGYGWRVNKMYGQKTFEHDGIINGFLSMSMYLPKDKIFVAVFSNCNCGDPGVVASKLAAYTIGELPELGKKEIAEVMLDQYIGVYETSEKRKRKIIREGQQLYTIGAGRERSEIYPIEKKDQFFFEDGLTSFQFARNEKGKIVKLTSFHRGNSQGGAIRISEEVEVPKAIQLDLAVLREYVGGYNMGPFKFYFTEEGGRFFGQPEGQSKKELFAKAKDKFFLKDIDAKIEFIRDNGKVTGLRFHQEEMKMEGQRIKVEMEADKAIKVSAHPSDSVDLKEFTGVYEFEGRQLTITLENGALYGQPEDESKEKLRPKGKDHFEVYTREGNYIKVEFQRQDGKVSAMKLLLEDGNEIVANKIK